MRYELVPPGSVISPIQAIILSLEKHKGVDVGVCDIYPTDAGNF